ncbi:DMT family transporter [Streptomyces bauhiniae]|uniref:DMT family transporter n=1 Tax=Streptomyces bauhiniae TaxID=2340725 RepID=A0A7K3QKW8_9ACTN|nr:DMT family transporter [Streptomyces bauhiniae]NEB90390.1 DMT family transporter [Streptomyces bauhiniae]
MFQRLLPALTVLLYALGYPLGALTLGHVTPFLLILLRFLISAVLMWTVVAVRRTPLPRGRLLAWTVAGGLLVQGMQFLGLYWGMAHGVGPGVAALVIAMNPVTTAVLARLVLGRRENSWGLVALALGTVGVVAACLPRLLADPSVGPGLITVLIALGGLSGGSLLQERKLRAVDPSVFTAIGVSVSVFPAAALALSTPQHLTDPVPALALLLLLVLASAVGMVCYAACVRSRGARGASILFAVIPAVSVIAAWGLQGAPLDLTTAVGLTCGALACVAQSRSTRPTSSTPARRGRGGTGRAATVPERVR